MTNEDQITKRVEEAAAKHDIKVNAARSFGDTLFIETDSLRGANELSYFAALLFYKFSEERYQKVAIRIHSTGEIEEFELYDVLGRLVAAAENDESQS